MNSDPKSAPAETPASVGPLDEVEQRRMLARYQELVDQKYLHGLSAEEAAELDTLGCKIDGFYDQFYEPILEDLQTRLKSRSPET